MRHLKLLTLSLLAAATLAVAGEPPRSANTTTPITSAVAAAPAHVAPLPLLWKVSDADNAVYLLGSFHLLKEDDYPVSADIEAALAAAARVVFEVTPEQLHDPANAQRFVAAASYADGRTLGSVLPAQLRDKLEVLVSPQGMAQLDPYEPWFVNLSLAVGLSQALGFRPEHGLDQYLMKRAAAAGKPTGGLETLEVQLQALAASPMSEQIGGLADFVDRPQDMPGMLGELHTAWRNGEAAQLEALTGTEMRDKTPQTYRRVIVDRNAAWAPQVRAMLDGDDTSDTLVVVGAMHLLGDDSVIATLRAHGYVVERICSDCKPGTDLR